MISDITRELAEYCYSPSVTMEINTERDFYAMMDLFSNGWLYRGQSDSHWELESTLIRAIKGIGKGSEFLTHRDVAFTVREFASRAVGCQFARDNMSLVEYMAIMQHYGAKTLLLDFTPDLYVALAFSEAYDDSASHAIWAIRRDAVYSDYRILDENFGQSFFTPLSFGNERMSIVPQSYQRAGIEEGKTRRHLMSRANALLEIDPNYEGMIFPGVQPLYLLNNNPRQEMQCGVFFLANDFNPFVDNLAYTLQTDRERIATPPSFADISHFERAIERWNQISFVKLILANNFAKYAGEILARAQVSKSHLFPDLVGLAQSSVYHARGGGKIV